MNSTVHKKIYKTVLEALAVQSMTHKALIEEAIARLYTGIEFTGEVGEFTEIRGLIGSVVSEMKSDGVILFDSGFYSLAASGPLPLRMERCEKEIVSLLSTGVKSRQELRDHLRRVFMTHTTVSEADDRMLFTYMGQILRRLTETGIVEIINGDYALKEQTRAAIDDLEQMIQLKADFISRVHRKGGEFFEHYILTLLKKNEIAYGKTVTECRTTGGTMDGGIDGIMKTTDHLGFKETVLIQAKNRTDLSTETTVRGFLGAVYASGGNKGIFATMSDFHPAAKLFLNSVDNLVGVNAEDIFKMACTRLYGIKKKNGKLVIDNKIL
jgi:hypothetical protein